LQQVIVIRRKIVYVNPPRRIDTSLIKERTVQHVSCFDSLDGSFQLKMTAGDYSLKWNDLRKSESFTELIKRDRMANGTYFYTITKYATDTLTYADSVTINEPPPLFFEYKITKTQDTTESLYNIASIIYGGIPDYEITWKFGNGDVSNGYNVSNVGTGMHIVEVEDSSKWILRDTIKIPDCDIINPVIIPDDLIEVCVGQSTELSAENNIVIDGFEQFYVLHNGDLSSVIDFNKDGRFLNNGTYVRNEKLYVSSIVIPIDDNSEPDFDYFCANIDLKSTPIVFYEPIKINADVTCYKCKGTFDVIFTITGGAADYSPNDTSYLVTGIYNGYVTPGKPVSVTLQDGSNFEIYVIDDGSGWGSKLIGEPIQCCKLPIELLHFTGKAKKEGNLLEWATASEIENDYFTIYHSADGIAFEELQQIKGQGTSSTSHQYNFLHSNVNNDITYYKLAQTDFNGISTEVSVISVIRNVNEKAVLSIYPNPASDIVQLTVEGENLEKGKLIIYNNLGDTYYESQDFLQTDVNINIATWQKGIYLVQVKSPEKIITKKLIKY